MCGDGCADRFSARSDASMNAQTANRLAIRLGVKGVDEYLSLWEHLMTQVHAHKLTDAHDFHTRCKIVETDGTFSLWCEDTPIDGIVSARRDVMRALCEGASSQLGK